MGLDKFRRKVVFKDGFASVGSVGVSGLLNVNTTATFGGPVVSSGGMTIAGSLVVTAPVSFGGAISLNAALTVNTPNVVKASSASNQFFGRTQINSAASTAVISTTAVKSNSCIFLTPILLGAMPTGQQASGTIWGTFLVSTITDGSFFGIAATGGVNIASPAIEICWEIRLAG